MESLESKLDRLSPDQRKETEDFVDFLLSRSGHAYIPPDASRDPPPVLNAALPPLSLIEPIHPDETRPVRLQDIARSTDRADEENSNDTVHVPFQEIGGGVQDRITHDYMDYGQFESHPSPATEAVKKVKRKLIAREGQDRPHHLLDWVD
jgi:hypothetical protein